MKRVLNISIVLLILKTATAQGLFSLRELREIIKENNIKSEKINSHKSNVYINDEKYEIYFYDTSDSTGTQYDTNAILKFYTCLNCEIAKWTRTELYKFVHGNFHDLLISKSPDNVFVKRFDQIIGETQRMTKKIVRYINVLLNVTDAINSPSIDRSVLTALLALRFKFGYMQTLRKNNDDKQPSVSERLVETGSSDSRIVAMVLKSINDMETYTSLNCDVTTFYDDQMAEASPQNDELDAVPLGLESSSYHFHSLSKTLMLTALTYAGEKVIMYGMLYVEISVGCGRNVVLNDLVLAIEKTYDLETIYWYQTLVLNITLSVMCDGILRFIDSHGVEDDVSTDVQTSFRIVNDRLFSEPVGVPDDVVECFRLFESKSRFTSDEAAAVSAKIKTYVHKLRESVNLDVRTYSEENRVNSAVLSKILDAPLARFLDEVGRFGSEYTSFMRLYGLLNKRYHSYYAPGAMNYAKITDFVIDNGLCRWKTGDAFYDSWRLRSRVITKLETLFNTAPMKMISFKYNNEGELITESDPSKNGTISVLNYHGCEYVKALIDFCLYVVSSYNTSEVKKTVSKLGTFNAALLDLKNIRIALQQIVKIYPNQYFQDIAYQTFPYFDVLCREFSEQSTLGDTLVRVVSLFVNALNNYGLEHCFPPTHSFVMFCKSFDREAYSIDSFEKNILAFRKEIESSIRLETLEIESGYFLNLAALYAKYPKEDKKYDNIIFVEWNGSFKSVEEIHKYLISTLVRPIGYYEFFDVLFKFYLAATYYELIVFYRLTNGHTIEGSCQCLQKVVDNVSGKTDFPDFLQTILVRLGDYVKHVYDELCGDRPHDTSLEDLKGTIEMGFLAFGVNINEKHDTVTSRKNYVARTRKLIVSTKTDYMICAYLEWKIKDFLLNVSAIKNVLNGITIYTT